MLLVMLGYESTDPCDEKCRKSILRCFIEGAFIADFARKLGTGLFFLLETIVGVFIHLHHETVKAVANQIALISIIVSFIGWTNAKDKPIPGYCLSYIGG